MASGAPTAPSTAITRLILQVFRLNGRLLAAGDRLVEDTGLTSARWQVLGAVALAQGAQPVANLARSMGLTRQAVQRTVNELAAADLLDFTSNPHHRTAQLVVLTKRGTAAYEAAHHRQVPWAAALARGVRDKDLAAAEAVLAALTDRLETAERDPSTHVRQQRRSRTRVARRSHA